MLSEKGERKMRKAAVALTIIFMVLTLVGVVLVICYDLNPANAVIPMLFEIVCQSFIKADNN